ncbi:MAG: histidine--tRNA ligase [Deltaproteobacteria bacterium]|nr:histidine--tRNA ligase [Deltaproteobacteria bacterium]
MKPQVLKGFRDYLPEEMLPRSRLIAGIKRVFEQHGFAPLDTPALEYAELLLGKYGQEGDKLLFRFLDNGERDVALRYDLTVPLARLLGSNPEILPPFKRYHIAPVWRAEKPARGRFREFMQCDVDIVGVESMSADAEVIATGMEALHAILGAHDTLEASQQRGGKPGFTVRLSNRKLLNGLCLVLGVPDDRAVALFRTLDKLDKQGKEAVAALLTSEVGLDERQVAKTFEYLECPASPNDLGPLDRYFAGVEIAQQGLDEMRQVVQLLEEHRLSHYLAIDPSIARGLDYYTGSIYETTLNGLDGFGSVMSGGRYDKLLDMFTGKATAAVGISVGLDRLLAGLIELKLLGSRASPTDVLVTVFSEETRRFSTEVASGLRKAGVCAELFLGQDKLGKQFRYADRKQIPYAIVCGPDEVAKREVKVKTLASGDEKTIAADKVMSWAQETIR